MLPASCGSSGSGVANRACKLSNTVRIVIAAALEFQQIFLRCAQTQAKLTIDLSEYPSK